MNVDELREKGNACVKEGNHEEAVLHYSAAIQSDPTNHALHSNRSLAFLKIQQYFLAYKDAKRTIDLKPDWAKGYFRKAEVEMATFHFEKALTSYSMAFRLQKEDRSLIDSMRKAGRELKKDQRADKQIPWVGAGIGIIVGVTIVLADYLIVDKPVLVHPILKVLMTIAISFIGFGFCKLYRYYVKNQRDSLLQPPFDLSGENDSLDNNSHEEPNGNGGGTKMPEGRDNQKKFTKAQARHRYRKGKSN
ncbi:uncharacterized protein LOC130694827 [Daphnia carinata]|uniref:uncharacterized protein LOC130694827 n=1 Tax=Daphnia carinata TaxID=120202 RepID=UPI00257B905A|nr:uncharacterized protein LOC130694827 [Daphnia carinata]